jgi:hypothetical protein
MFSPIAAEMSISGIRAIVNGSNVSPTINGGRCPIIISPFPT